MGRPSESRARQHEHEHRSVRVSQCLDPHPPVRRIQMSAASPPTVRRGLMHESDRSRHPISIPTIGAAHVERDDSSASPERGRPSDQHDRLCVWPSPTLARQSSLPGIKTNGVQYCRYSWEAERTPAVADFVKRGSEYQKPLTCRR